MSEIKCHRNGKHKLDYDVTTNEYTVLTEKKIILEQSSCLVDKNVFFLFSNSMALILNQIVHCFHVVTPGDEQQTMVMYLLSPSQFKLFSVLIKNLKVKFNEVRRMS